MLVEKAAERGTTPAALVPAGTRVATIGPSSRQILEAVGIPVALAPVDIQSAEGLVDLWTAAPERVLLPQADIAAPGLREGLAAKGADVTSVVAYHTVDFPARPELRLEAELPSAVGGSTHARSAGAQPVADPERARRRDASTPSWPHRRAPHAASPRPCCRWAVAVSSPSGARRRQKLPRSASRWPPPPKYPPRTA